MINQSTFHPVHAWVEWELLAIVHFQKVTVNKWSFRDRGRRRGEGAGRPVGIVRNNPNLRSSVLKLGWGAFGNGPGSGVAENIEKGKSNRSL